MRYYQQPCTIGEILCSGAEDLLVVVLFSQQQFARCPSPRFDPMGSPYGRILPGRVRHELPAVTWVILVTMAE